MSRVGRPEVLFQVGCANSFFGDGLRFAAVPLLAAQLGAGPHEVSMLFVAGTLPWLVVSPFVGALVDRADRSVILVVSDTVRLVCSLTLVAAVAVLSGGPAIALLVLLSFAFGVLETAYDVTGATLIPSLVPDSRLEPANAWYSGSQTLGRDLGGPLAGAVLHGLSRLSPYAIGAVLYAAASVALLALHRRDSARRDSARRAERRRGLRWREEMTVGLGFLVRTRLLAVLAVVSGTVNLSLLAAQATSVLFVLQTLGGSGLEYSLTVGAPAAGALVASVTIGRVLRRLAPPVALILAIGGAALAFAWVSIARSVWWAIVGFVGLGACFMLWNVLALSLRQRVVPDDLRGRVESAYRAISWGGLPIGAALGGLLAGYVGSRAPFVGAAVLTALAAVVLAVALARTGEAVRWPTRPA